MDPAVPTSTVNSGGGRSLLKVHGLSIRFATPRGPLHAVSDANFELQSGRTLVIVGESGSGKSVLSRSLLRLLPQETTTRSGVIDFQRQDLNALPEAQLRGIRGRDIGMIFQDPMSSINPVLTIERQIGKVLTKHLGMDKPARRARVTELLRSVGIAGAEQRLGEFSHQLPGGMRQRVMIAMAMACGPKLLIADEPTTALDVTIQMQILVLLRRQQRERGMAMIFISHDLAAVRWHRRRRGCDVWRAHRRAGTGRGILQVPAHALQRRAAAGPPQRGGDVRYQA